MATQYDLCLITAGDRPTADKLAEGLLKGRLAACVTVLPGAESSYWWKDRVEKSQELLLLVKTRRVLREDVIQFVKRNHPYENPETVFFEIDGGAVPYLDWLGANTLFTTNIPKDKAGEAGKQL